MQDTAAGMQLVVLALRRAGSAYLPPRAFVPLGGKPCKVFVASNALSMSSMSGAGHRRASPDQRFRARDRDDEQRLHVAADGCPGVRPPS
jgi:hypothetical protein